MPRPSTGPSLCPSCWLVIFPPSRHCALEAGSEFSVRSFLSLQPSAVRVSVCAHQGPPYSMRTCGYLPLTTWTVWFFCLPPNKATRFKHKMCMCAHTHTYTKTAGEKTGPNNLSLLRTGAWQGLMVVSDPCQSLSGRGDLGRASAQCSRSWEWFFKINRKSFLRKTFYFFIIIEMMLRFSTMERFDAMYSV